MTFFKTTLLAAIAALSTHAALAQDYKVGNLSVVHPYSFATPPGAAAGAGYLTITNEGTQDDRLVAVQSTFPKTMVHKTEMVDGIMKMRHQMGGVPIPAGQTVTFEPGGLHVMFMGLKAPFVAGEKTAARLVFERAGSVDVMFNIEKRGMKTKKMDHSGHSAPASN